MVYTIIYYLLNEIPLGTYETGNDNLKSYTSDESFVDPNKRKLFPNKRFCSSSDDQLIVGLEKKTKHLEAFTLPPMPPMPLCQSSKFCVC